MGVVTVFETDAQIWKQNRNLELIIHSSNLDVVISTKAKLLHSGISSERYMAFCEVEHLMLFCIQYPELENGLE
jgi:hypothetical protein